MGVFSLSAVSDEIVSSLVPCSRGEKESWDSIAVLPISGCWDTLKRLLPKSEATSEVAWNKASLTSDGRENHSMSSDFPGIPLKIHS